MPSHLIPAPNPRRRQKYALLVSRRECLHSFFVPLHKSSDIDRAKNRSLVSRGPRSWRANRTSLRSRSGGPRPALSPRTRQVAQSSDRIRQEYGPYRCHKRLDCLWAAPLHRVSECRLARVLQLGVQEPLPYLATHRERRHCYFGTRGGRLGRIDQGQERSATDGWQKVLEGDASCSCRGALLLSLRHYLVLDQEVRVHSCLTDSRC